MKTKKILVALLALGAYLSGNSQSFTPLMEKAMKLTTHWRCKLTTP